MLVVCECRSGIPNPWQIGDMQINIMVRYCFVLLLTLFFLLAACTPTNPTGDVASVTASRPAETDTATAAPTDVSTAIPTTPIANESAVDQLVASLSERLKTTSHLRLGD